MINIAMQLFNLSKLNFHKSRIGAVIGLILTQLLFAAVSAESSCFASACGPSAGPQAGEFQGLANHCSFLAFNARDPLSPSFENWLSSGDSASAERTVRQVVVDIDHDGDPDLITVTNLPRLLIWVNDGRGPFTRWDSSFSLHSSNIFEDAADSNDEDTPLFFLWLEVRALSLQLIPLASTQPDPKWGQSSFDCLSQSSPRAPPLRIS
jgi:hypothetical protein